MTEQGPASGLKGLLERLRQQLGNAPQWAWIIAAGVLLLVLARMSVTEIEPGQVAVKVNNISGSQTPITQPGWTTRLPFVHSVYLLDAKPQTFRMKGKGRRNDDLNVAELSVRASDGSNFHFTDTTIIFQLSGDKSVEAVRDTGLGDGYLHWLKPFARSILRDEFGRESTINVSNPTTYGAAATRARDRLNKQLSPHGIRITQLVTPRPRFNQAYEKAIEDRNALSNQLKVIKSDLSRAATRRQQEIAAVDQAQNKLIQQKRANLEADLAEVATKQAQTKRKVDAYRIDKIAEGQAAFSAAVQRAKELTGELDARYKAKQAEIQAFRTQPVERVMERLGNKLNGVTIRIQPWANDSTPSTLVHKGATGGR
ncbi:MAG: hypothetical protein KC503_10025 [Myxococcales bacterium]|nr:hypothetical protein [Myxococcales bacterium]